ncbi:unnamed protein product [Prorocentrum cordatum]|uniref:Uncharacterized protein n=1 Tax=Prorocentrum cordatum TaxID=2364126 RepID=A0ABN9TLG9_9DINO|nr:unnamed protein product [Polarella glacialis]
MCAAGGPRQSGRTAWAPRRRGSSAGEPLPPAAQPEPAWEPAVRAPRLRPAPDPTAEFRLLVLPPAALADLAAFEPAAAGKERSSCCSFASADGVCSTAEPQSDQEDIDSPGLRDALLGDALQEAHFRDVEGALLQRDPAGAGRPDDDGPGEEQQIRGTDPGLPFFMRAFL